MANKRFAITTDQKPSLTALVRKLPGILAGKLPDEHGLAAGFRARLGFAILSLIEPNFNQLGRGETGADGTKWAPLSPEYLAYGRRFGPGERKSLLAASGLDSRKHRYAPNEKKGLLTAEQLKLWRKTYADRLAWYIMREPEEQAKSHAAAVAWIVVKQAGGKTKLEVFGNRKVQILVDTGYLRGSITPGTLNENGVNAEYIPPSGFGGTEQVMDTSQGYQVIVGTNVEYARRHHFGKGRRYRPLWPSSFPQSWWDEILGVCIQGLQRINELYRNQQGA